MALPDFALCSGSLIAPFQEAGTGTFHPLWPLFSCVTPRSWHLSTRLSLSMMTDTDHVMSAKSDEYLKKVEQAEESARTTRDLSAKLMYQEIAEHYRYLAEHQIKMDGWRFDSE